MKIGDKITIYKNVNPTHGTVVAITKGHDGRNIIFYENRFIPPRLELFIEGDYKCVVEDSELRIYKEKWKNDKMKRERNVYSPQLLRNSTTFEITIDDEADSLDDIVNGTVHFKIPIHNDTLLDNDCACCIKEILEKLNQEYSQFLQDRVDIKILDCNFRDGWIDYSLEGEDEEEVCIQWKELQGISGIPDNVP